MLFEESTVRKKLKEYIAEGVLVGEKRGRKMLYRRSGDAKLPPLADAGVKDIILPGEIREIMNTVLIAEKRAQANVIARREEVASTRSLLNTARLMDENQTLYRLKELEHIERICENVGNINLSDGTDILSQLAGIVQKR